MSAKTNAIREDYDRMRRLLDRVKSLERTLEIIRGFAKVTPGPRVDRTLAAIDKCCREALEEK